MWESSCHAPLEPLSSQQLPETRSSFLQHLEPPEPSPGSCGLCSCSCSQVWSTRAWPGRFLGWEGLWGGTADPRPSPDSFPGHSLPMQGSSAELQPRISIFPRGGQGTV